MDIKLDDSESTKSKDKTINKEKSDIYENMIQELEAEIRNHVRIACQLNLNIESHQTKLEESTKTIEEQNKLITKLKQVF